MWLWVLPFKRGSTSSDDVRDSGVVSMLGAYITRIVEGEIDGNILFIIEIICSKKE